MQPVSETTCATLIDLWIVFLQITLLPSFTNGLLGGINTATFDTSIYMILIIRRLQNLKNWFLLSIDKFITRICKQNSNMYVACISQWFCGTAVSWVIGVYFKLTLAVCQRASFREGTMSGLDQD
jgi:hypothetical protein